MEASSTSEQTVEYMAEASSTASHLVDATAPGYLMIRIESVFSNISYVTEPADADQPAAAPAGSLEMVMLAPVVYVRGEGANQTAS